MQLTAQRFGGSLSYLALFFLSAGHSAVRPVGGSVVQYQNTLCLSVQDESHRGDPKPGETCTTLG